MSNAQAQQKDLKSGKLYPQLIKLAAPAALGMMFNTLYNLTDTWFAGQISDQALAALSIASLIFFLTISIGNGMRSGTSAMVAPDVGNDKKDEVLAWVNNAFGIGLISAAIVFVLAYAFGPMLLSYLASQQAVADLAWEYLSIILFSNVVFAMISVAAGILVGHGDTVTYRNVLMVGFFVNLGLNPLFIFVFDFGIAGLAWATILIKIASAIYLIVAVKNTTAHWPIPAFKWARWQKLFAQIAPASLNMIIIILGSFVMIKFVGEFGDDAVAGYSVGLRIEQVLLLPALGLNAAMMAMGGQNFGVDQYQRIKDAYHKALKLGMVVAVVMIPVMLFASPSLVNSFSDTESVATVGISYMRIDAIAFFAYVVFFISVGTLQAIKQPNFPMILGAFRQILIPVGIYYLLVVYWDFGVNSLFYALVGVVSVSAVILYLYTNRQLKKLIADGCMAKKIIQLNECSGQLRLNLTH
ncbi:MATE family efflux transporter [Marinicella sp. S1101]|nr:MATE family efflux transporter [Marinicella marina]